jgi:SAM-dependent methyltransferase
MAAIDYSQVAELYDAYVQTEIDVPFFLNEAQGCQSVLELTSGTGRLSIPLIQAGVPLSCLDNSPEMLTILRRKMQAKGRSAPVYEMDLCDFLLPDPYDLIIIPFNSFAEITQPDSQRRALTTIRSHLTEGGRLICTLHNPAARLKLIDGQIHWRGKYPLPENAGTLMLSTVENFDANSHLVKGAQFYEIYTPDGAMQMKRFVTIEFYLHSRESFEALALAQGYTISAFYGDYQGSVFDPEKSPFMIWVLSKH